jgi:hypothetical protein
MSLKAMIWVFDNSPSTLGARLVLLALAEFAHDDGRNAFPNVDTLCGRTRMSRKGVQAALRRLEADGAIAVQGRTRSGTFVYRIVMAQGGEVTTPQGAKLVPVGGEAPTPEPTTEPTTTNASHSEVDQVFEEWKRATERTDRVVLDAKRRGAIKKALKEHGLEVCLAAVRNIGADAWARGANDRGQRFDDIQHALGSAERVERWAFDPPSGKGLAKTSEHAARRQRRGQALRSLTGDKAA